MWRRTWHADEPLRQVSPGEAAQLHLKAHNGLLSADAGFSILVCGNFLRYPSRPVYRPTHRYGRDAGPANQGHSNVAAWSDAPREKTSKSCGRAYAWGRPPSIGLSVELYRAKIGPAIFDALIPCEIRWTARRDEADPDGATRDV